MGVLALMSVLRVFPSPFLWPFSPMSICGFLFPYQVYTWMDATLRELTDLVKEVQPAARRVNARLDFALVYPDRKGRNVMRQVGTVFSTRDSEDDFKTLRQLNFQVRSHKEVQIQVPTFQWK